MLWASGASGFVARETVQFSNLTLANQALGWFTSLTPFSWLSALLS